MIETVTVEPTPKVAVEPLESFRPAMPVRPGKNTFGSSIEALAKSNPSLLAEEAAKPGTFSGLGASFVLGEIKAAQKKKKKTK
jgi:hypothetical protein